MHILEAALLVDRSHILVAHSWACGRKVLEHGNLALVTRDDSNDDEYVLAPFFGTLVFLLVPHIRNLRHNHDQPLLLEKPQP